MNLTIMIATKDRPEFLLRTLKYYHLAGFKGQILIGDSSNDFNSQINISQVSHYKQLMKIEYFIDTELSSDKMILFLSKKVKTDYSVMMNDDDILIVSSIIPCIEFLESHSDYSAVNGKAFSIGIDYNSPKPFGKVTLFKKYPLAKTTNENSFERIKDFFDIMLNINMSITRSNVSLEAFETIKKLNKFDSSFVFGELMQASVVLSRGKIGTIDNCYLVRQKHTQQHYRSIDRNEWIKKSNFINASVELKNVLINELSRNLNLTNNDIIKIDELILSKTKSIINKMLNLKDRNFFYKLITFTFNINGNPINILKNTFNYFIGNKKLNNFNLTKSDQASVKLYLNLINKKINFK